MFFIRKLRSSCERPLSSLLDLCPMLLLVLELPTNLHKVSQCPKKGATWAFYYILNECLNMVSTGCPISKVPLCFCHFLGFWSTYRGTSGLYSTALERSYTNLGVRSPFPSVFFYSAYSAPKLGALSGHLVIGQLRSHETNRRRVSDNNNTGC